MLNDTRMEFDSTEASALESNMFAQYRHNMFDYKLHRVNWENWICISSAAHRAISTTPYYLYKILAHHSNLRNDQNHRNIYPVADTSLILCTRTQIFCMDEPARWDLIIKRYKRRYHIGWSRKLLLWRKNQFNVYFVTITLNAILLSMMTMMLLRSWFFDERNFASLEGEKWVE